MYTASTSGSGPLPSNTIANPKGKLKAITTRSGLVLDGPFIPMPPSFINSKEDEHAEETLTDSDLAEYTIKVPYPLVQKAKPPSQRNYVVHQRDPHHPNIPYPSRMYKEKQQDKDKIQIHKFWQMFKQLHINITLADALILIPKYQKMLKALLSNKVKLLDLANTPLNENCLAVILKKLPEKLRDPRKFLIPCSFSELKCKALAVLGKLKAITTRSGLVLDGPFIPMPPSFINSKEDEHAEETLTDSDLAEYTIKVPYPLVQKAKPPSQRNYVVHQRDPHHPNIPYPSRMYKEKQQDKDKIQIHKFWQMF
nr:reverse transcriptase domain-containing protein [Tanacetum cinerariifolium]